MECEKCQLVERLDRLEASFDGEKHHSSDVRKEMYQRLRELEKGRAITDERYISISKDLEELKKQQSATLTKLDELANKPAKRWDNVISGLVGSIIGAVVAFVSSKLLGG